MPFLHLTCYSVSNLFILSIIPIPFHVCECMNRKSFNVCLSKAIETNIEKQ